MMNRRTLSAAVFATALLLQVAGCHKKTPVPNPQPPSNPDDSTIGEPKAADALAVRINSFTAEPRTIERGQSAMLRWSVGNATDMSIDPGLGAVVANGSRQVFPSATTTYTLTAKSASGSDSRSVTVEVASNPAPPPPRGGTVGTINGAEMLGQEAQDAYFDYDKNDVREDARQALSHDAELLKRIFAADSKFSVVIEGHCDERGSAEYNLGLGDRRAIAAKEYLIQLGLPGDRINTISYGKERPTCTDPDEGCYQRNRRAHLAPAQ